MTQRLRSLDIFRGASVALMILVNNPGNWSHLYAPLDHAAWHGLTPTDLVFPFFLFAVGNALALVLPGLRGQPASVFWWRTVRRTVLIFGIGLFLNATPFVRWDETGALVVRHWETLRIMGVLQRIALAFGAAAVIVWLGGRRGAVWAVVVLLLGYWAACQAFGDPADPYSLVGWFGTAVDKAVLGASHLYRGEGVAFDPEGLASTAPAVAQVLLGWWVGDQLLRAPVDARLLARLFAWATALLVTAYLWQLVLPLNKKIWTPSYVLMTTGYATLALSVLLHRFEVGGRAVPAVLRLFEAFGRNPLFVFVLSGFVPRVLALVRWHDGVGAAGEPLWTSPRPWAYQHVFAGLGSDPRIGSLLFAVANLALYAALAWALDRRGVYIRV